MIFVWKNDGLRKLLSKKFTFKHIISWPGVTSVKITPSSVEKEGGSRKEAHPSTSETM